MVSVTTFYHEHPINEGQILEALAEEGIARDAVTPQDLSRHDQDHYGGLPVTDALAAALKIVPDMQVLDLCSGMGGTSRYLAYRYGARVLGLDLTESRVASARYLTELVGLQERVSYAQGDAARLDLPSASFDRVVSQEAFLHIDDRESLLAGCYRVLKAGGGLGFTDWVASEKLDDDTRAIFADSFAAARLPSLEDYKTLLRDAGFADIAAEDLSTAWRPILQDRLEMYRSLEAPTVARFGRERFEAYIRGYETFVAQIDAGALGGGRFVAWKN